MRAAGTSLTVLELHSALADLRDHDRVTVATTRDEVLEVVAVEPASGGGAELLVVTNARLDRERFCAECEEEL